MRVKIGNLRIKPSCSAAVDAFADARAGAEALYDAAAVSSGAASILSAASA